MAKNVIIDPEWEEDMQPDAPRRPRRPHREEPEDLDPFGVERVGTVSGHDGERSGEETWEQSGDETDEPPFDPDPFTEEFAGKPPRPTRKPDPQPEPAAEEPPPPPDPFAEKEERLVSRTKQYIGMLLSGSILTRTEVRRSYPYMILIAFLMLLYISSLFRMQHLHRREQELTRQVKELRATSLELSSRRMNHTRQSYIIEELNRRGIPMQEAVTPPKIIEK